MVESDLFFGTDGPRDAEIVLVGEAWGEEEFNQKKPFVGTSGNELNRMLAEAGIQRKDVLLTNTVATRPYRNEMFRLFVPRDSFDPSKHKKIKGLAPTDEVIKGVDILKQQIHAHKRKLVIATGNYPLWALSSVTGAEIQYEKDGRPIPKELQTWTPSGSFTWRGSMWHVDEQTIPLLPIIHPAAIMRQWSLRAVTVHDLKARVPMGLRGDWRPNPAPVFWAPPSFEQAKGRLEFWLRRAQAGPLRLACDIETTKSALMTCIGFADSVNFAMSIPWVRKVPGGLSSWWTYREEAILVGLIRELMRHPNVWLEGQNFLYDIQYIQYFWGVTPKVDFDTMLAQHLCWPGTPKGLDYISSLYCRYHWYWKDDAKEWNEKGTVEQLLEYNCMDLIRTFEAADVLRKLVPQLGLAQQWERRKEHRDFALRMMNRGTKIDMERKGRLSLELQETLTQLDRQLLRIIPQSWLPPAKKGSKRSYWMSSPKQRLYVFEELLGMKIPKKRSTGKPTIGKDSIPELKKKYPIFEGIFDRLEKRNSIAVFKSHFVDAKVDWDKRIRCQFKPDGTETFRFSSSTNAFGRGTNLQNLPTGDEE